MNRKALYLLILVVPILTLALAWGSSTAGAQSPAPAAAAMSGVDVTIGITPSQDNTLYEHADGALSNGAGQHFFVGRTQQEVGRSLRRGLIAFDIAAAIPPGSHVKDASLSLNMTLTLAQSQLIGLHPALAAWGEGSSDAPGPAPGLGNEGGGTDAAPGDATWLHRSFDSTLWSSAGGDYATAATATSTVGSTPGPYGWSSPAMATQVQSWLDNPAGNFGWVLVGNEEQVPTAMAFATREFVNTGQRPTLTITFEPATVTYMPVILK